MEGGEGGRKGGDRREKANTFLTPCHGWRWNRRRRRIWKRKTCRESGGKGRRWYCGLPGGVAERFVRL